MEDSVSQRNDAPRQLGENESSSDEDDYERQVQLSDTIIMFPNQKLTKHRNVVAGEICSKFQPRPCVIKFDPSQINNETRALLKLGLHTNIVGVIENGTYNDMFSDIQYIALEKYHKLNLEDYVVHHNGEKILPVYDVRMGVEYCKQIVAGMTFIHEKLIIHKDLKPSNILLSHDLENIRIADFGSSQVVESFCSMVPCPCTFGTLGYRPPESLDRSFMSLKSDVYSLGVLFYFLLSKGKSPFGFDSDKWEYNTQNSVVDISDLLVSNPSATAHLIWSMLNKERCRRPSIYRIASHPCWDGKERDVGLEYPLEEEYNDSEMGDEMKPKEEYGGFTDEFMQTLRYLDKLGLESGLGKSQSTPGGEANAGPHASYLQRPLDDVAARFKAASLSDDDDSTWHRRWPNASEPLKATSLSDDDDSTGHRFWLIASEPLKAASLSDDDDPTGLSRMFRSIQKKTERKRRQSK